MKDIKWHIERYDTLRQYLSSRASIIFGINAIVISGLIFIVQNIVEFKNQLLIWEKIVLLVIFLICIVLIALSFIYLSMSIGNVWKRGRKQFKIEDFDRYFYHPSDTVKKFDSFNSFKNSYENTSEKKQKKLALGELYTNVKTFHFRYQYYRKAIKYTTLSILLIMILFGFSIFESLAF
nr:hypothetical protein [uncultured Carboxylicivirga sp.]